MTEEVAFMLREIPDGRWRLEYLGTSYGLFASLLDAEIAMKRMIHPIKKFYDKDGKAIEK